MAFRRKHDQPLVWKKWVERNRDELIASGVPAEIYSDELRWLRFLEENGLDGRSGWRVEMLSTQQAERFHRFLINEIQQDELNNFKGCLRSLMNVMSCKK